MSIPEFIDSYSDDIIYLEQGRRALLTHPLMTIMRDWCNASFCRMFAIMMIGSFENFLQEWKTHDKIGVLDTYLSEEPKVTNGGKVRALYEAFHKAGINVDREIFDDYLAIKYLRNVIVHAGWKPHEKEWLRRRHFPTDVRSLNEEHWGKMQLVNQNMILYVSLTSVAKDKKSSNELVRFNDIGSEDTTGIIRQKDIPRIYWTGLERISEVVNQDIQRTALENQKKLNEIISGYGISNPSEMDGRRLYYCALRELGKDGVTMLTQHQDLATDALEFWKEFWRLTFPKHNISLEDIVKSKQIIHVLHQEDAYPEGQFIPLSPDMPVDLLSKVIKQLLKGNTSLDGIQIAFAIKNGYMTNNIIPNVTALSLLITKLPIIDPKNSNNYLEEGDKALTTMELSDYWYSFVERRTAPNYQEWEFYRQLSNDFRINN